MTDLLVLAEACERAGAERIVDETDPIFNAIGELGRKGFITEEAYREAVRIVRFVNRHELPRSCLLGAATMLVPAGCSYSLGDAECPWAYIWRKGRERPLGCVVTGKRVATIALALCAASLRAHHAAAADDGE